MLYYANDNFFCYLTQTYTYGDTTLYVDRVPNNVPTILVGNKGTNDEIVLTITGKGVTTLTGVAWLKGAQVNILSGQPLYCLNNEEFLNQYSTALEKATGSEINTGTEDGKIVTPKAIKDANLPYEGKATGSDVNTGTNETKYVSSKAIADSTIAKVKATADEVATGTDDVKYTTPLAVAPYANSSVARQAIINGNFDVWQRGTSTTIPDTTVTFLADRWADAANKDGGTLPTLTRSRQAQSPGALQGSFYFSRLNTNGAGSSFGAGSNHQYYQNIEHGTRLLCGLNKKVTLSFWAKSDIANKKIGVFLNQRYGTGGSPTASEVINGTNWTLTSIWTKYTYTFTTNTLSGKTFGTANDDYLRVAFFFMWGTTYQDYVGASGAETYVGSGNIDIAQVQVCAGEVALPFQPRSFGEELRLCQRYYEKIGGYVGQTYCRFGNGHCRTTTSLETLLIFKVPKRDNSYTLETSGTASDYAVYVADSVIQANGVPALVSQPESNIYLCPIRTSVASGLTVGQGGSLISNNNATAFLAINNEF